MRKKKKKYVLAVNSIHEEQKTKEYYVYQYGSTKNIKIEIGSIINSMGFRITDIGVPA